MANGELKYAKAADGAHLAYQVFGTGTVDLLIESQFVPVEAMFDDPELASALDRLGDFSRVIAFDKRGSGASDALSGSGRAATAEESTADIVTVMDAAGVDRATFLKIDNSAPAVMLAAAHPDRVAALVLLNAFARLTRAADYLFGIPEWFWKESFDRLDGWDVEITADLLARERADDPGFRRWFLTELRHAASPGDTAALFRRDLETDVRHVLPLVQVPTLVLHSAENPYVKVDHGRYLAEHIKDARFVALPGAGHALAAVDLDTFVDEMVEFITGTRPTPRTNRVLATVLFTDIVDSTPLAVSLGDRPWKARLDQHDGVVRRQLERFGGRLVKSTGDGAVATFDGPARAINCAAAIRDGLQRLEIGARMGIHAGEVEMRGADVSGIAVHVASRVQAAAAPGQIVVSRTVVDLVAGSGITFDDLGDHSLKGVPGEWRLFALAAT